MRRRGSAQTHTKQINDIIHTVHTHVTPRPRAFHGLPFLPLAKERVTNCPQTEARIKYVCGHH